jgi:hypothetical protein
MDPKAEAPMMVVDVRVGWRLRFPMENENGDDEDVAPKKIGDRSVSRLLFTLVNGFDMIKM